MPRLPYSKHYTEFDNALKKVDENTSTGHKSTPSSSTSSTRTTSATSLEPTTAVAEWCHQMHLMQHRKYDWCEGCHPKVQLAPLKVPSQKVVQRQIRSRQEPTHAYQ
ncbi:hypothetical protein PV10_02359 [Exophiala mesophila]|uniref:Uncharacterized protein n=1 Tax=Exophiala mesophila TaxID=212818 RepID=A0A0D2A6K2_EXOME|nr:uncharacterized protein PV10_02359 [Exophiala mesophila]KIV94608.1 hypothetical protein PV10_02359 [Exophiala mesophila]